MIAALLLLLQAALPPAVATLPPQDWSALPVLHLHNPATTVANTSAFVHGEVVAGRCAKAVKTPDGWSLTVDLAVLATPGGRVRRITPRAIDCPTVEQYASGVVSRSHGGTLHSCQIFFSLRPPLRPTICSMPPALKRTVTGSPASGSLT